MSEINSKEEWILNARELVKDLPEYLNSVSSIIDVEKARNHLESIVKNEDWELLHNTFEETWQWLPDVPNIRTEVFFRLCDLCSESWVLNDN